MTYTGNLEHFACNRIGVQPSVKINDNWSWSIGKDLNTQMREGGVRVK